MVLTQFPNMGIQASVQALDECGFDQEITAGAPLLRPGDLQQKAGNRPDVRTTLLGACRNRKYTLRPDFAATNQRALPSRLSKGSGLGRAG